MKKSGSAVLHCLLLSSLIFSAIMSVPTRLHAQQGEKAVYATSNNLAPSTVWVDASAFCGPQGTSSCTSTTDLCSMVNSAIAKLVLVSPAGGIVDARGVLPPPGSSQSSQPGSVQCNSNPFSSSNGNPITILLPAFQINFSTGISWTIPNNVHLVGAGLATVLLGPTSLSQGATNLIEMGVPPSGGTCSTAYTGIVIEHLQINANGAYGGIDNQCATSASYVNDVRISGNPNTCNSNNNYQGCLQGNALTVGTGAINSGPYTDIIVLAVPGATCGPPVNTAANLTCVSVNAQTRGIRGVTCLGNQTTGSSASVAGGVVVSASNNSIQDVHVESFYDGIEISGTTSNVLVSNIATGGTSGCSNNNVTNAVHICGHNSASGSVYPQCSPSSTVTNVSLTGIANDTTINDDPILLPNTVLDDQTATIIGCNSPPSPSSTCIPNSNPLEAMGGTTSFYVLGGPSGSGGPYTRLTVSPANSNFYGSHVTPVATWGVGATVPTGQCYTPGAIYSDAAAASGPSVYVCAAGSWTLVPTS